MIPTIEGLKNGDIPLNFDWTNGPVEGVRRSNRINVEPTKKQIRKLEIVSEDLRDGLHGVEKHPDSKSMVDYIGKMHHLGIRRMTVGIFPGENNAISQKTKEVLREMNTQFPDVTPIVLSLATESSEVWTLKCKDINPNLNAIIFMGTAPTRMLVEGWSRSQVLDKLGKAVSSAVSQGVEVIGATEHTTQTPPDFLEEIIRTQVDNGANQFCIADTIGISRPKGTVRIVNYVKKVLHDMNRSDVKIEWHGHRDMGNAGFNAVVAAAAGANRIHTVAGGIGERAGNTSLEEVLINLNAIYGNNDGKFPWQMRELNNVLMSYYALTEQEQPSHGTMSRRSHHTSLGIHTAAQKKASELAEEALAAGEIELSKKLVDASGTIYTAVDPTLVGKEASVAISPWSGTSTVMMVCSSLGIEFEKLSHEQITGVLDFAKSEGRELSANEVYSFFKKV